MKPLVDLATIISAVAGVLSLVIAFLLWRGIGPSSPSLKVAMYVLATVFAIVAVSSWTFMAGRSSVEVNSNSPQLPPTTTILSSPSVEIVAPEAEDTIPYKLSVKGKVSGVRPGQVVWIVDREPGGGTYYPHDFPCPIDKNGGWQCDNVYIGVEGDSKRDVPKRYEIIAVIADGGAQHTFIQYNYESIKSDEYRGIEGNPEGVYVPPPGTKGRVTVSRDIEP